MKKDLKNQKKPLRVSSETLRLLSQAQLAGVVGASNNPCAGSTDPDTCPLK